MDLLWHLYFEDISASGTFYVFFVTLAFVSFLIK